MGGQEIALQKQKHIIRNIQYQREEGKDLAQSHDKAPW